VKVLSAACSFVISVLLKDTSARNNSTPAGWVLLKFYNVGGGGDRCTKICQEIEHFIIQLMHKI